MNDRARDPECIFCRIVAGEIPSTRVAETEDVLAILDINPTSPTHILLMPRQHIRSAAELTEDDAALLGGIFALGAQIARDKGIAERGYRMTTNVGSWGGQSVDHLHFHLMGGRQFSWPPG